MVMTTLAIEPYIRPENGFWNTSIIISIVLGLAMIVASIIMIGKFTGKSKVLFAIGLSLTPLAFVPYAIASITNNQNFRNQALPGMAEYLEKNYSISGLPDEDLEKLYRGAEWYGNIENAVVKTSNYGYIVSVREGREIVVTQSDYQPTVTEPMEPKVQPMSSENAEESTW
jgi:hypothetical protein